MKYSIGGARLVTNTFVHQQHDTEEEKISMSIGIVISMSTAAAAAAARPRLVMQQDSF